MALTEMFIVAACLQSPAGYGTACNKAVDAGTRQIGIRQEVDKAEELTTKFADKEANRLIGKPGLSVIGTTMFLYKTSSEKKLGVDLPNLGLCDNVHTEVSADTYNLRLQWNLK